MAPSTSDRRGLRVTGVMPGGRRPAEAADEMSPSIWGHLPEHLLDRIVALLPIHSLLSLRPTCRRFHSLLLSPSFLSQIHTPTPSAAAGASSYFLLSHPQFSHRFLPIYDSAADCWRKLRISISPSHHLLSSSSGLLCFSISHPSSSLLVNNLLTLSSRIIPFPNQSSSSSATLISSPSPSPHGYKIFLPSSSSASFSLYDSDSRSWTSFTIFEPLLALTNTHQDPVFFNGFLYFATPEPFSVVGFNLDAGRWEAEVAPELPPELTFVRLIVGDGGKRLFLVGGVGMNGISRSLKVWEMVAGERQRRWEEAGRLPEMMCRKFVSVCYHNYSHVFCLWHEGMVCVCCTTWPEVLFLKLVRGTWHWLPKCPLLQEKWSCGFRWFSFVPDLYAMV